MHDYLATRLRVLRRQRRDLSGPITNDYHRLDGAIAELEHVVAALKALDNG